MAASSDAAATAATRALLERAHSPSSVDRIYNEKIQFRNLVLRPTSPPPSVVATRKNARDSRRKSREDKKRKQKLRPVPLSSRKRRAVGLYDIPRKGQKYAIFEPLHRLWLGYIREILGGELYTGGQGAASKLSSAEFHGAEVEVSRSSCPSRVGIKGIVVKDAKFIFEIITRKNKIKLVPKEGTMFRVEIPVEEPPAQNGEERPAQGANAPRRFAFEIHGDQFLLRGADRANKKYKAHFLKNV